MNQQVKVKAVPVNGLVEFVERELTPQQIQSVLAKMPPEEGRYFTGHLLAHEQVPLAAVNRYTRLAAQERGEAVTTFAERAGRFGAKQGLKTVYKFILLMISPEAALKKAPLMWSRVYDSGEMSVESEQGHAFIHIRNFAPDEAGCGRITGWFETIGEATGAKSMTVSHAKCAAHGASECVWEFTWKP
ncbi:MAG: hypothetical protein WBX15_11595 [Thermoanaerobaculia bacterium]